MRTRSGVNQPLSGLAILLLVGGVVAVAAEDFPTLVKRLQQEKPGFAKRHQALLAERYDLANRPAQGVTMSKGKPVQEGVRVKLRPQTTWEQLAAMSPDEIKSKNLWPAGFYPLPHPHHEAGGMIFPQFHIDETKNQTQRDLTRFDLDFDLPDHLLPEFPAPIYLTTRPDLGDVSKGKLVTLANFNELFKDILNPKQLEGLRLLVTPFPQQQFNATDDRRSPDRTPGRRLLRLPRQRPHERRHAHRRRHPPQRASPSHRYAVAARRQHSAAVRFAARPEDRRGLHGVRAAGRLFRRRPRARLNERESIRSRTRQPGAFHGRVPGSARLPARAQAQRLRQARPRQGHRERTARPGAVLRQGAVRAPATRRPTTPTT